MGDSSSEQLFAKGKAGPVFAGQVGFDSVCYDVNGKHILNDISLTVQPGQIACLLGPSGCGKTTLLRLAAGILRPTSGRVLLDAYELSGPNQFIPPERRNIGLVFQDFALFPHMTAVENVAYGLYALDRAEALRVASIALDRVGLGKSLHRAPHSLSGGEQQRVALARALVPRPQVLLLDEPFSGLDERLKDSVREDTLALLRETRATAILVTHDPDEALAFADQIHVMQKGHLVQSGSPTELLHEPYSKDVAQFFRTYNQFRGRVKDKGVVTPLGPVLAPAFKENAVVDVLIAPTGIRFVAEKQGIPAYINDNRDLGGRRRILARVEGHDQHILVMGVHAGLGAANLALTGDDIHIFEVKEN
jgi:iron(III) transport system ATP-binding protein